MKEHCQKYLLGHVYVDVEYLALPVSVAERLRKNVPYSSRAPQGQGSALTPPAEGPPGEPGREGDI